MTDRFERAVKVICTLTHSKASQWSKAVQMGTNGKGKKRVSFHLNSEFFSPRSE